MMTREDKLYSMKGSDLIKEADKLGIKVQCNKTRTQLTEAKSKVIDRILATEVNLENEVTDEVLVEIPVEEEIINTSSEAPITQSEELSEEPKQNVKAKIKKSNLKLSELTYNGETKTIRQWAEELEMPWATLYDRVNRNGWTTEEAIETPLGERRKKVAR